MARDQCFNEDSGDRPDVKNIAIVITDGVPYPENRRQPAIDVAKTLHTKETTVIAIGITNVVDMEFLKLISSAPQLPNKQYFSAPSFTDLSSILQNVTTGSCEETTPPSNAL